MSDYHYSFALSSSSDQNSVLRIVALIVLILHISLLGLGYTWQSNPPIAKKPIKLIVQTIKLDSFHTKTNLLNEPAVSSKPLLTEQPSLIEDIPLEPPKVEESLPMQEIKEVSLQEEPILSPVLKETLPKLAPLPAEPIKIDKAKPNPEIKTSPLNPVKTIKNSPIKEKPAPPVKQEVKKQPLPSKKEVVPVKKPAEKIVKPIKKEEVKAKNNLEIEKKLQKEKIETEKKQKLQKEAEQKKQQELLAAQEAIQQEKQLKWKKMNEQLAKTSESRAKMDTSVSSIQIAATDIPKEIGHLQIDALPFSDANSSQSIGIKERNYSDEVAVRLKKGLQLPDYGAVKIKLTLNREGKVIKVETLQSESQKNKNYLESKIPSFSFPSFGQQFSGSTQNTFIITLQNDS